MKNKFFVATMCIFLSVSFCFAQLPEQLEPPTERQLDLLPATPRVNWDSIQNSGHISRPLRNSNNGSALDGSSPNVFKTKNNTDETVQNKSNTLEKSFNDFKNEPASEAVRLQPVEFNSEKTNAQRFFNSPCYATLGFDPRRDPQVQERIYRECEDAKSREETEKNLKIGLGVLLVCGFGCAIVYTFNKGQKKITTL